MTSIASPLVTDDHRRGTDSGRTLTRLVRGAMEADVLAMVCLSPWAFGAVEPEHEFLLDVGIAVLMLLSGARMLLDGQLSWRKCPVAVCLAAWILLGVWQLTPLPRGLLSRISPVTTRMYDRLLPAQPEVLPFRETEGRLDAARRLDTAASIPVPRGGNWAGTWRSSCSSRSYATTSPRLRASGVSASLRLSMARC